jgi:hypothetical protein
VIVSAPILQFGCTMMCPHGGQVQAVPSQTKVLLEGQPALLVSDTFLILGCPFVIGIVPSPCISVTWTAPAAQVQISGQPPLLQTSLGLCNSPAGAPQGTALISGVQTKVMAQ